MGNWNLILISLLCINLQLLKSCAYEIGCIWPPRLSDDVIEARRTLMYDIIVPLEESYGGYEDESQPIIARRGVYMNGCGTLCLAFHDPDVLDPFTKEPTFTTVPSFGQNAYSSTMCHFQCMIVIWEDYYDMMPQMVVELNNIGVDVTVPSEREDISAAMQTLFQNGDSISEIMTILNNDDFHPYTMGLVAGSYISKYMRLDGFNAKGLTKWCPVLQQEVTCTANCRKFQDTTGYVPVPDPRYHTNLSTDLNKYNCTGLCRHWQPEQRMDSTKGTILREEFAVPHIGIKARTFLRDTEVILEDPEYDYYRESLDVVERVDQSFRDAYKMKMIDLFHGDGNGGIGIHQLRGSITNVILSRFRSFHSYQDQTLFRFGFSLAEYESFVHAYREKVHHDLVRPTTVIKQWGDDMLNIGGRNFAARDFEAIYPMLESSAEYPSELSCACTAFAEFTDSFVDEFYGGILENIAYPYGITFRNMTEFNDICGQTQLWAGYHFPASVTAGVTKCSGLGALAVEYIKNVRNDSTYNGGWYTGDTLPSCPP